MGRMCFHLYWVSEKPLGLVPPTSWFLCKSKELQVGVCNKSMELVILVG